MTELVLLSSGDHHIRMYTYEGEPLFVAVDACKGLGLDNTARALSKLDADERMTFRRSEGIPFFNTITDLRIHELAFVTEPGLYKLAVRGTTEGAKKFARWITHDVLPELRKTGQYAITAPTSQPESDDKPRRTESVIGATGLTMRQLRSLASALSPLAPEAQHYVVSLAMQPAPPLPSAEAVAAVKQAEIQAVAAVKQAGCQEVVNVSTQGGTEREDLKRAGDAARRAYVNTAKPVLPRTSSTDPNDSGWDTGTGYSPPSF